MTYGEEGKRESLKYRFIGSTEEPIGSWGHEYVRHLSAEIMQEYENRAEVEEPTDDLLKLALEIVPFFLQHNAEADAVDLLLELEAIEELPQFVDKNTYERVCLYMLGYVFTPKQYSYYTHDGLLSLRRCVNLLVPPDDVRFMKTARIIYRQQQKFGQALNLAIRMRDLDLIKEDFESAPDT